MDPFFAAGQPQWKGLTWGMMPLLAGALCACTHHFFYNDPKLDSLVALQVGQMPVADFVWLLRTSRYGLFTPQCTRGGICKRCKFSVTISSVA